MSVSFLSLFILGNYISNKMRRASQFVHDHDHIIEREIKDFYNIYMPLLLRIALANQKQSKVRTHDHGYCLRIIFRYRLA